MQMTTMRIFYSKTARAKYISHLDTMRTVTRALRRSGLPLWYTEGFNPHLYITFALPISLGYEGLRESFDVRVTEDIPLERVRDRIGKALPMGFQVLEAALPVMEPSAIAWADYDVRLIYAATDMDKVRESFPVFESQPVIEVLKKTKKGDKMVDIRPFSRLRDIAWREDGISLTLRMAAGITTNINPTLYLKAFYKWSNTEPEGVRVVRTAILNGDMNTFC